jgi:hypothetical protein
LAFFFLRADAVAAVAAAVSELSCPGNLSEAATHQGCSVQCLNGAFSPPVNGILGIADCAEKQTVPKENRWWHRETDRARRVPIGRRKKTGGAINSASGDDVGESQPGVDVVSGVVACGNVSGWKEIEKCYFF